VGIFRLGGRSALRDGRAAISRCVTCKKQLRGNVQGIVIV